MGKPAKRSSRPRECVDLEFACQKCGATFIGRCPVDVKEHAQKSLQVFLESTGWRQLQEGWKCGDCTGILGDVGKKLEGMGGGAVHVVVDPDKGDILRVSTSRRRPRPKVRVVTAEEIRDALKAYRFRYSTEKDLQAGIERALQAAKIPYEREKDLGGDLGILDFVVERIGVEIKTKGSPSQVARQLQRYCQSKDIDEIILVTGKVSLGDLPPLLNGKPIHLVALWGSFL